MQPTETSAIPPVQDADLLKIASPARENKRLAPAKMQNLILDLCRSHELTGRDIAELVQRNQDRVLKSYLRPMVEKGLLDRKYPDDPYLKTHCVPVLYEFEPAKIFDCL